MIFKEFQSLVDEAGSRYGLIISVTKRARDIKDGSDPLTVSNYDKSVSIATKEFAEGKIEIVKS
ncbi:MAG: DNA-directed RNA polymerase subunit omega [Ruminococcaceae bacterium]|jgi:DNA-directed RNA polymerase omega subunit|nr:DNA-directed RNA polymerase subunit omega [Oscillospiraceae bacterium]